MSEPSETLGVPIVFDFDSAGAVTAVHISDSWSSSTDPELFGYCLLIAHAQQRTAHATPSPPPLGRDVRYPASFRAEVTDLSRDAVAALRAVTERLSSLTVPHASTEPSAASGSDETVDVRDRRHHISIEVLNGVPRRITVSDMWLRQADLSEIESDIAEAFGKLPELEPSDELTGTLATLRHRYAQIIRQQTDYLEE